VLAAKRLVLTEGFFCHGKNRGALRQTLNEGNRSPSDYEKSSFSLFWPPALIRSVLSPVETAMRKQQENRTRQTIGDQQTSAVRAGGARPSRRTKKTASYPKAKETDARIFAKELGRHRREKKEDVTAVRETTTSKEGPYLLS